MAAYGDPAVSGEDAERMSWGQVGASAKGSWTPDLSQQSASESLQQTGQAWQATEEDLTTSGQYGTQLRVGGEFVRESVEAATPEDGS